MKAIATTFEGVKYRSRLEARWAELLSKSNIAFEYEPDRWNGEYRPDFYLLNFDLFVEIKPMSLLDELHIFSEEIQMSGQSWICVDKWNRSNWAILLDNPAFSDGYRIHIPPFAKISFANHPFTHQPMFVLDCPTSFNSL